MLNIKNNLNNLNETNVYKTRLLNNTVLIPINFNNNINYMIDLNNYINEGRFAKIYKIKNGNKHKNIIYKSIISKTNISGNREYIGLKYHYILQQYLTYNKTNELKYLCKLYEYGFINNFKDYKKLYAIMDNCGIDLGKYIISLKYTKILTLHKILYIIEECAKAIKIIHDTGYVHMDIKPQNFLINLKNNIEFIKIIDFGIIIKNNSIINKIIGTQLYMPPEIEHHIILKKPVNIKFDIFSLGCMFFQFLIVLEEEYNKNIFKNLFVCPLIDIFDEDKRLNYKKYFNGDLEDIESLLKSIGTDNILIEKIILIITQMINPDPNKRYDNISN